MDICSSKSHGTLDRYFSEREVLLHARQPMEDRTEAEQLWKVFLVCRKSFYHHFPIICITGLFATHPLSITPVHLFSSLTFFGRVFMLTSSHYSVAHCLESSKSPKRGSTRACRFRNEFPSGKPLSKICILPDCTSEQKGPHLFFWNHRWSHFGLSWITISWS